MAKTVLLITHEETDAADYGYAAAYLTGLGHTVLHHTVLHATKEKAGFGPADTNFPRLDGIDSVIMFGSFTHAYAAQTRGWVDEEVAYVKQIRDRGMPYLGICFGAQILAEALGGKTVKSDQLEAGMIEFTSDENCPIAPGPWFSWHNDRVELPADIEILASSDLAPQIFRAGNSLGVQFHPEVTDDLVEEWLQLGSEELPGTIEPAEFRRQWLAHGKTAQLHGRQLFEWFMRVDPASRMRA